ncbi:hypothetical protein DL89DRAFT_273659 [Linderina pennispora]|uniref:MFS general substrate transporter n=1 Tax=Linderina pennispora TaxID=61395 RepID=A0A1Y1WLW0_9FUNG|nr:uncharacterized protein DL89DRAFT_273659 [Linderina pennispora]ORX74074.1 hypothetical protein DL89DRAFT_273659 [Linderina pennispora]
MTVLLAGIQFVWTVELGYGTPYLLSLGLSKPLMTLVWMAGPLSGLIIQPVVGGLSDKCTSRLGRRRPYIIGGAAFVVMSMVAIAYARELAQLLAQLIYGADPSTDFVTRTAIVLAVIGFYVLDFSINTSQACARALALDIPPLAQQDLANAYAGRMLNLGSVSGYLMGFMDLRVLVPAQSQMQALCVLAILVFVVREQPLQPEAVRSEPAGQTLAHIVRGVRQLPAPVQRICNVQVFAWIAWFPFLFFATTWVTEIMARTEPADSPEFLDRATRAGSFALFLYSVTSLGCSLVLPVFVSEEGKPWTIGLRAMWRLSLLAMGLILLSTYFVPNVLLATVVIVSMAFPWALAMWAPFALVGDQRPAEPSADDRLAAGTILGIHNMYVVLPQFLINGIASLVFAWFGSEPANGLRSA